ncbi:MAG TPA: cell division protein FtsZ [Methanocella sp.]|nr:cell division protein FtsZ [Methanocella sp.]
MVVGVGGFGNNVIHRLSAMGLDGAETVAVDTDMRCLSLVDADQKIPIGNSIIRCHGTSGSSAVGGWIGEKAVSCIGDTIKYADLVFVTAGVGGVAGTGAVPMIAKISKDQGALVIAMVILPLAPIKKVQADLEGWISKLHATADMVILLDARKLQGRVPDAQEPEVYSMASQLIADAIQMVIDMLLKPPLINIKFSDLISVVHSGQRGNGIMLMGECSDKNFEELVKTTLSLPLSPGDYWKAPGGLLIVTGGQEMSLRDAEKIGELITDRLDKHANILWNVRIEKDYEEKIRVMAILIGLGDYSND